MYCEFYEQTLPGEYFDFFIACPNFVNINNSFKYVDFWPKNLTYFEPPCKNLLNPNEGSIHRLIAYRELAKALNVHLFWGY